MILVSRINIFPNIIIKLGEFDHFSDWDFNTEDIASSGESIAGMEAYFIPEVTLRYTDLPIFFGFDYYVEYDFPNPPNSKRKFKYECCLVLPNLNESISTNKVVLL